jgi:hypothetical protein
VLKWQSWYSLPSTIHFRKFHRQYQCTLQHVWGQHISIFGICEDVRHFSQHSYNVTSKSQRPTDASHWFTCFRQWRSTAGGKDSIGCQIQTTGQWNSSISETVRSRTHVYINFLRLEWPILWPPRILTFLFSLLWGVKGCKAKLMLWSSNIFLCLTIFLCVSVYQSVCLFPPSLNFRLMRLMKSFWCQSVYFPNFY